MRFLKHFLEFSVKSNSITPSQTHLLSQNAKILTKVFQSITPSQTHLAVKIFGQIKEKLFPVKLYERSRQNL